MKKRIFTIVILILGFSILPRNGECKQELTDEQKKEKIYQMYEEYKKDFPEVIDISPQKAMSLMETGKAVFVDTRKSKEMKVSMIPGAITQEEFLNSPEKYKDNTVIAYCTISYRSGKLSEKLGKKRIIMYNLAGGILAWVHEGGKLVDANGGTKKIHVYGRKWNLAPQEYESIW